MTHRCKALLSVGCLKGAHFLSTQLNEEHIKTWLVLNKACACTATTCSRFPADPDRFTTAALYSTQSYVY